MANQNYRPGVGRLATDRYDFQDHVDGNAFEHKAEDINLIPSVVIDGYTATNTQSAIKKLSQVVSPPVIQEATTTVKGIVQLAGDIDGTASSVTVAKIQGLPIINVSAGSLTDGDVLTWDYGNQQWEPKSPTYSIGPATTITPGIVQLTPAYDIGGLYNALTVEKIQGNTITISSPNIGEFIGYDGSAFVNTSLPCATTSTSGVITVQGDIGLGATGVNGCDDPIFVTGLQGKPISETCPDCDQVLTWDCGTNEWTPKDITITPGDLPTANATDPGAIILAGDIGGSYDFPKVIGWNGYPINDTSFTLSGDGGTLGNDYFPYYKDGYWETQSIDNIFGGDLENINQSQKVIGIYGNPIVDTPSGSATGPSTGDILYYHEADGGDYPSDGWYVRPLSSLGGYFTAGNDLTGTSSSQNVVALTGATGATGYPLSYSVVDVKSRIISSSYNGTFSIIKRPTNSTTYSFSIRGQNTSASLKGGDIYVIAGSSTGASGGAGGIAYLLGGDSTSSTGGNIDIYSGFGSSGSGNINIKTQNSSSDGAIAGSITIQSGSGTSLVEGYAGNLNLISGDGYDAGGNVIVRGGTALNVSGGIGGNINIYSGTGISGSGSVNITTPNSDQAGYFTFDGGNSSATGGYGGSVVFYGGNSSNPSDGYGGFIYLKGGISAIEGYNNGPVVLGSGNKLALLQVNADYGGYVALATNNLMLNVGETNPTAGGGRVVYIQDTNDFPTGDTGDAPIKGTVLYSKNQDLWISRGGTGGVTGDGYLNYYDPNYSIAAGPNPINRSFTFGGTGGYDIRSRYYKYTNAAVIPAGNSIKIFEHNDLNKYQNLYLKGNIIFTYAGSNRNGKFYVYDFYVGYRTETGSPNQVTGSSFTYVINGGLTGNTAPSATGGTGNLAILSGHDNSNDLDCVINIEVFASDGVT